jgi:hypothetical protein
MILNPKSRDTGQSRSGVALVLVLGLLSVMMISAVAFSISMRIERRGSFHYRYGVQARHMLWSALAEAVTEINRTITSGTFRVYPPWDIVVSSNIAGNTDKARVVRRSDMDLVPLDLQGSVKTVTPYWQPVFDGSNNQVGRYAYVVVNESGMVDVNMAGGAGRTNGLTTDEIQLSALPEVGDGAVFEAALAMHCRYEDLNELAKLNNGLVTKPNNMAVYSLSREDERIDYSPQNPANSPVISSKANLSSNYATWFESAIPAAEKQNIKNHFINVGIDPLEVEFVYSNFLDYIDADCVPRNLAAPYTEPVPMINEFRVMSVIRYVQPQVMLIPELSIEVTYPFMVPTTNTYSLDYSFVTELYSSNGTKIASNTIANTVPNFYGRNSTPLENREFCVKRGSQLLFPTPFIITGTAATDDVVTISYKVYACVKEASGGTKVDEVVASPAVGAMRYLGLTNDVSPLRFPVSSGQQLLYLSKEAFDPRFNWDDQAQLWKCWPSSGPTNHTLGTTNYWTTRRLSQVGRDQGVRMHVGNNGKLFSVGELGNLLLGTAWNNQFRTLRLIDKDAAYPRHKVFENFSVVDLNRGEPKGFTQGRVNLNTRRSSVVEAVLTNCPIGYFSLGGATNTSRLNGTQVAMIRDMLMSEPSRNFYDVGEVGSNKPGYSWATICPTNSDCERESVICNFAELFTVRHNLFLVLLATEASTPTIGGGKARKLAGAHAVVELWRDPFCSYESGAAFHRMLVRQFKITEE